MEIENNVTISTHNDSQVARQAIDGKKEKPPLALQAGVWRRRRDSRCFATPFAVPEKIFGRFAQFLDFFDRCTNCALAASAAGGARARSPRRFPSLGFDR